VQHFAWPGITFFVAGAVITWDRWSGKIAKCIGTRLSALHSTFHIWKKSRRIASLLMLSSSKIQEVSHNCFVLDGIKFQNWGSLSELLRFGCCQVQKLRKSRRICSFLTLSSSKIEEVSQNCFVLDVVKFKNWGSLVESFRFWHCQVQKLRKSRNSCVFKLAERQTETDRDRQRQTETDRDRQTDRQIDG